MESEVFGYRGESWARVEMEEEASEWVLRKKIHA